MNPQNNGRYGRKYDLTKEEVRALPAFKNWTDKRIENLIRVLKRFCRLVFHIHSGRRKNGKIIDISNKPQIDSAA